MKSWISVFNFTFRKIAGRKGYIATTVVVALLLLAGISAGMLLAEKLGNEAEEDYVGINRAVVVGDADIAAADALGGGMFGNVAYENVSDFDAAAAACEGDARAVILIVENGLITAVVPENSDIEADMAANFAAYLASAYPYTLADSNIAPDDTPVHTVTVPAAEADEEEHELNSIVGMIVPYIVVMLMYFMVLIYGQSIANEAITEKTSKLMDMFLVSVKPEAMMLGKVLAGAAAGLMQALIWIFAAVGGCALGVELVRSANPHTQMALVALFEGVGGISAMFSPAALATSALIIISGFVVYCALAGIGGALASKHEDLGSCNYLFTMALVISFFACLFGGESAGMISEAAWMAYVPFTAVLVMPGRLLTGAATVGDGFVSIIISCAFAVMLCMLAGRAYALTAFYRGKPLNPIKILRQLASRRGSHAK